jgi:hypothetical protein
MLLFYIPDVPGSNLGASGTCFNKSVHMRVFERGVVMRIFGRNREEDGENNMTRNFVIPALPP